MCRDNRTLRSACPAATQRDGAGLGRRGQHAHRFGQRGQQLLGAIDAIPVPRHRPEAIVDRHVLGLRRLELLQHGRRRAIGEDVAGQQQHRQAIDRRAGGAGHHVGRAGADRRGARQRAQPIRHLRERGRGVHHRLFVPALVVAQPPAELIEGLANPGDVAMAEDAEHCRRRTAAAARRARSSCAPRKRTSACAIVSRIICVSGFGIMTSRTRLPKIVARGEELPQRAARRRERIELVDSQGRPDRRRAGNRRSVDTDRRRSRGSTGVSMRGATAMSLAAKRFCHAHGGEITTSPPINSLQCM